jgi:hypothetical protein
VQTHFSVTASLSLDGNTIDYERLTHMTGQHHDRIVSIEGELPHTERVKTRASMCLTTHTCKYLVHIFAIRPEETMMIRPEEIKSLRMNGRDEVR